MDWFRHDYVSVKPSVSIVIPACNRGHLLGKTLESIRQQAYPSLEVIVVEDGDDGITESVTKHYDAKYFRYQRTEEFPPFQSVATIRNIGVKAATGEILIIQDAETFHEAAVISDLVGTLGANPKTLAASKTKVLDPDGKEIGWLSGFVGACPSAIDRATAVEIGGYEEQFFGYGCEDDWYIQLLLWNGIKTQRTESIAAHQWHSSHPFEPFTGQANRALAWALTTEVLWGNRPPRANIGPITRQYTVTEPMLSELLSKIYPGLVGQKDIDVIFDARNAASAAQNENPPSNPAAYAAQKAAEVAWGLSWASRCHDEAQRTTGPWAARLTKCQEHHLTLADSAYRAAQRVLNGEIPSKEPKTQRETK